MKISEVKFIQPYIRIINKPHKKLLAKVKTF